MRRQSSIGQELLWLGLFFVVFGAVAALVLNYAAAHRFNDRIAILLSALAAGLITTALRARFFRTNARRQ